MAIILERRRGYRLSGVISQDLCRFSFHCDFSLVSSFYFSEFAACDSRLEKFLLALFVLRRWEQVWLLTKSTQILVTHLVSHSSPWNTFSCLLTPNSGSRMNHSTSFTRETLVWPESTQKLMFSSSLWLPEDTSVPLQCRFQFPLPHARTACTDCWRRHSHNSQPITINPSICHSEGTLSLNSNSQSVFEIKRETVSLSIFLEWMNECDILTIQHVSLFPS